MQIEVRPGLLYFVKGKEEGRVKELVASLRSAGYRLMIISSRHRDGAIEGLFDPTDIALTLTESVGPACVDPQNLMVLTDAVTKFIERGGPAAFMIEDLGILKEKNDFPKVLRMLGFVNESLAMNRGIGIAVIDPQSWDKRELAYLGKEGWMVEEKDRLDAKVVQPSGP